MFFYFFHFASGTDLKHYCTLPPHTRLWVATFNFSHLSFLSPRDLSILFSDLFIDLPSRFSLRRARSLWNLPTPQSLHPPYPPLPFSLLCYFQSKDTVTIKYTDDKIVTPLQLNTNATLSFVLPTLSPSNSPSFWPLANLTSLHSISSRPVSSHSISSISVPVPVFDSFF